MPIILKARQSAGPSLNKNVDYLTRLDNRGVIIVVDTSLPLLLDRDIKPDFIVTTEPINTIYEKVFKNYPELDLPLLYIPATSNKLYRQSIYQICCLSIMVMLWEIEVKY